MYVVLGHRFPNEFSTGSVTVLKIEKTMKAADEAVQYFELKAKQQKAGHGSLTFNYNFDYVEYVSPKFED